MQDTNLNSLYYFFEIAKAGSLKQAALKLHLTQPTLSHQLKSLESSLNTILFDRVGKKLLLNKEGELVLEYCYRIFPQLIEMKTLLDLKKNRPTDQLHIGVLPSISKLSVYKVISQYIVDQSIKVSVKEDNLNYLLGELEKKDLDIIFTDFKLHNLPKSIIQEKLFSREFVAVCHPKCHLKRKPFPHNIEGLPFINYTKETALYDKINYYLHKKQVTVQNFTEIDDTSLIKELLINQKFAAILPLTSVEREVREKKIKKLSLIPEIKSILYILINDDNTNPVLKKINRFSRE